MIKFYKRKKREIDLIPMINIIFLLLIFFMLTGTIQKKQSQNIDRVESKFSLKTKDSDKSITIIINKDDLLFIENSRIKFNEITEQLSNLKKNTKIILDIDKETKVSTLNKILKTLKNLNFEKVFIKTKKNNDT